MALKDYLRILRRRWHYLLAIIFVSGSLYGLLLVNEEDEFDSTAILIMRLDHFLVPRAPEVKLPFNFVSLSERIRRGSSIYRMAADRLAASLKESEREPDRGHVVFEDPIDVERRLQQREYNERRERNPDAEPLEPPEVGEAPRIRVAVGNAFRGLLIDTWRDWKGGEGIRDEDLPPVPTTWEETFAHAELVDLFRDRIEDWIRTRCKVADTEPTHQTISIRIEAEDRTEALLAINSYLIAVVEWNRVQERMQWNYDGLVLERLIDENKLRLKNELETLHTTLARRDAIDLEENLRQRRQEQEGLENRIGELEARKGELDREIEQIRESDNLSNLIGRPTSARVRTLQDQRDRLRAEIARLLRHYTVHHPDVQELQMQLTEVESQIAEAQREAVAAQHVEAEVRIRQKQVEITHLQARIREIQTEKLPEVERDLVHLLQVQDEVREQENLVDYLHQEQIRLRESLSNRQIAERSVIGSVRVDRFADAARTLPKPIAQAKVIAGLMIVAFGLGVIYLMEYLDTRIKSEQDVRKHMNLPILARIEKRRDGEPVLLTEISGAGTGGPFVETFYTAATLMRSTTKDLGLKTLMVSSTVPEEGKTTITVNLGIALARKGLQVILVDSDLRRPQIHDLLGLDNSFGLSSVLDGRLKAREILGEVAGPEERLLGIEDVLQTTPVENLRILTSGPCPPEPVQLLESVRMKALIEEMKGMADYVIFDTPPIFNVGDALTLASLTDANIFVVGAMKVRRDEASWAKHLLSNVESNILGVFLNMEVIDSRSYYYYYNRYYKQNRSR